MINGKFFNTSGAVKSTVGRVFGLIVNGTVNAGFCQLRDGGASGTIKVRVDTEAVAGRSIPVTFSAGVQFMTDIYVELSNCTATVIFE